MPKSLIKKTIITVGIAIFASFVVNQIKTNTSGFLDD